jgi:hypothetical protein
MTEDERRQLIDGEHLRLLRLGFLIAAAANTLWIFFGLVYILFGLIFFLAPMRGLR